MTTIANGSVKFLVPVQVTHIGGIPQLKTCSGPTMETGRGSQGDGSVKG